MKRHLLRNRFAVVLAFFAACNARGYDLNLGTNLPSVGFHGFASEGFLYSDKHNYLGDSSRGSFRFSEAGLNTSVNPFPRTRIALQGFCFDVGNAGNYSVNLDYALAEYTFSDYVGIRAGRIRRPEGIYNDIQDVDLARTWVLLPQGMYNSRWRDSYGSLDGGELFGGIPLSKAGSFTYQLYYGLQRPQLDGGLALQKANLPPYWPLVWINAPQMGGEQIWWNTPLDGLRAGVAINKVWDLSFRTRVSPGHYRLSVGSPFTQRYSVEYLWKSWTFQAEYLRYIIDYENTGGGPPKSTKHLEPDSWYAGTAYRFNKYVEAGGYYTEYYADAHDRRGATLAVHADGYQKDAALSLRFDPAEWWIFKVEGHYIRGTAQLFDNVSNPKRDGNGWWMIAVKTTFHF